jgi:hypothetical protein
LRRLIALCASAAFCLLIVPVFADWSRVQINGVSVCKDASGATFKPPYSAKADVTKACNVLTSFVPWLGTAEAGTVLTHTVVNPDGTQDSGYPNDGKSPSGTSLSWDEPCLVTALAVIALQSTGTATSIDIGSSTCLSGTDKASATITLDSSSSATNWSIASGHLLTHAGAATGSGNIVLRATYNGNFVLSHSYPWVYQSPPATDSLAPPVPTDIRTTGSSGQVVVSGDTPWDACGSSVCKGAQDIQIQLNGSGTLTTVSVGPGFSCNPTLTNIGTMGTTPTATQTGNDWSIAGAGTMDGASDAYAFNNCSFSGAGFSTAILNGFSGAVSTYQKQVIARRESQTAVGSRAIIAGIERASVADGSGTFLFVDARVTTDASRVHLVNVVQVTPPICAKLEWDSNNVHTVSTATVTGGQCNNDWVVQLSGYTLAMPATTYVGLGVSSGGGSSGTNATASLTQFNLNNLARWTYTHTTITGGNYAARARDKQGTPNASAYSATKAGSPSSGGSTAVRWHPSYIYDCSENGNPFLALGNSAYAAVKTCIDNAATYTNVGGIFVLCLWTCFEGDTLGSYDGTVGNSLGGAGTIGYPLIDDLLTYAASKSLKVIIGINWNQNGQPSCNAVFPAYLIQPTCTGGGGGGTDSAGTYGITFTGGSNIWARLWKAAEMDRYIALMQAYGTRYNGNSALEAVVMMEQDPSFVGANGLDGFSWPAYESQTVRLLGSIRSYWLNTNLVLNTNWYTPAGSVSIIQAMASAYVGVGANNSIIFQTSTGELAYLGPGVIGGNNYGTTDYRTEIPFLLWTSGPELCDLWDSYAKHNGLAASSNTTPQQFYDIYFTSGKSDVALSPARPLKPAWWIVGGNNGTASYTCASVASQQWGTTSSGGWRQHIGTAGHTLNTTAPTLYPSVNTN